jgi:squalene synthase HpnC/squalene synthase HpnD
VSGVDGAGAAAVENAYRVCARIARAHVENFAIGSQLLPRRTRHHLAALYAFARTADDVADEGRLPASERLAALDALERSLEACFAGRASEPIFVALAATASELALPIDPLRDLLRAFRRDVGFRGFATFEELRGYCRLSADPVGRLVLLLFGVRAPALHELSDQICTGLQLANFWQDLSVDLARGRLYLPHEDLERFGVSVTELALSRTTHRVRRLLAFEVERARALLLAGSRLARHVEPRLALEVRLFAGGGLAILRRIERLGFEVLGARPALRRVDRARVALSALLCRPAPPAAPVESGSPRARWGRPMATRGSTTGAERRALPDRAGGPAEPGAAASGDDAVERGYAICRAVVRASSSSFLPAFRLLPPDRRDALCAVYTFCRHVDDIADGDDLAAGDPARLLARWHAELDAAYAGAPSRPITVALSDAVRRFGLPKRPFLEVLHGVETDLSRTRYETFDELEGYCYRVASAVGLLCIEIFGYASPSSRDYARDLGLAFQLTNILRDVREDAERGRIYLPREDRVRFGVREEELLAGRYSPRLAALMAFECGRARAYYLRARGALAPVDRRSLGPAEAMRRIYEGLLDRIEARSFDVFASRITLSSWEKAALALAGWGRARFGAAPA